MSFPERSQERAEVVDTLERPPIPLEIASPVREPRPAWMRSLSDHYAHVGRTYPNDDLCVVFDIDGTILDIRHLVVHVLLAYDRARGTEVFRGVVADDIAHHEEDVEQVLASLDVPPDLWGDVAGFYRAHLWDRDVVSAASRPFEGVLGVIRWFQLQPRTCIALNTGRPDRMRELTLGSLNAIGANHRVRFTSDLLFTAADDRDVPAAKVEAIRELENRGLRVVAVIDNEPENLRAMAGADPGGEIMFLHADTIFASQRLHHEPMVAGSVYRLRDLVPERSFSSRVEFVWHGVNDEVNLERFLASDVTWAEIDVRRDPLGRLVLRHDGFDESPWRRDEPTLHAVTAVHELAAAGRSVKLDVKEDGATLIESLDLVRSMRLDDRRLWFNAELPVVRHDGFELLRERFPGSTISAPLDLLLPLMLASDAGTDDVLGLVRSWGISRLSFRWSPHVRRILDDVETRGWEVNLYGVPDLEAFLEASLLLPTSVTADFNFPEWRYFGRGSGAAVG